MALMTLLALPLAWVATVLRGYLSGISTLLGIIVVTQIVTAISGAGGWFPYAAPSLWTGMGGAEAAAAVTPVQLMLAIPVGLLGAWAAAHRWRPPAVLVVTAHDLTASRGRVVESRVSATATTSRSATTTTAGGYVADRRGASAPASRRSSSARRRRDLHAHRDRPEFGGRGLGSVLIGRALADVAEQGMAVEPECVFVAGYLDGTPRRRGAPTDEGRGQPDVGRRSTKALGVSVRGPRAIVGRQIRRPARPARRGAEPTSAFPRHDRPVTISLPVRMDICGAVRRPPGCPERAVHRSPVGPAAPPLAGPGCPVPPPGGAADGERSRPVRRGAARAFGTRLSRHPAPQRSSTDPRRSVRVDAHRPVDEICGRSTPGAASRRRPAGVLSVEPRRSRATSSDTDRGDRV